MNRIVTLFFVIISPLLLLALVKQQIVNAQPLISGPMTSIPEADSLTVTGAWQAEANALETFALTITIANNSVFTMTDLLVTSTVPANAHFVSGGTLVGDEIQYELDSLPPGCCASVSFYFTATQPIGSNSFGLTAQDDKGGLTAFTDTISDNWNNWSWGTITSLTTSVVYTGSHAMAVDQTDSFAGLFYAAESNIGTDDLASVRFWIHGGPAGGQDLGARLELPDGSVSPEVTFGTTANVWTEIEIPIDDFGTITDVVGIIIQSRLPTAQPLFYVDEVGFVPVKDTNNVIATNILLPQLSIEKSAPESAASGASFIYTISVGNQGPGMCATLSFPMFFRLVLLT